MKKYLLKAYLEYERLRYEQRELLWKFDFGRFRSGLVYGYVGIRKNNEDTKYSLLKVEISLAVIPKTCFSSKADSASLRENCDVMG